MATGTATRPDTTDMVIVHRVFRREFRLLPQLVRAVVPGDRERARTVTAHGIEMIETLHHHHSGEDALIWPRLRERADLHAGLIERMQEQHHAVAALIDRASALLPTWSAAAGIGVRDEVAEVLEQLSVELDAHLDEEEREVLPLIEQHLTLAEWAQVGERGMASIPKSRLLVFLGHLLEETSAAERARFLVHVPLPGRVAFRLVGQRKHRREVDGLRGGIALPGPRQG
ncbi:MAG: hemerythrin cation binding domain protein [Frankiales bacterium]|nr:hemerythrin cation binding domain protein [Frankiales bacterium]